MESGPTAAAGPCKAPRQDEEVGGTRASQRVDALDWSAHALAHGPRLTSQGLAKDDTGQRCRGAVSPHRTDDVGTNDQAQEATEAPHEGCGCRWQIEPWQSQDIQCTRDAFFLLGRPQGFFQGEDGLHGARPVLIPHALCSQEVDHRVAVLVASLGHSAPQEGPEGDERVRAAVLLDRRVARPFHGCPCGLAPREPLRNRLTAGRQVWEGNNLVLRRRKKALPWPLHKLSLHVATVQGGLAWAVRSLLDVPPVWPHARWGLEPLPAQGPPQAIQPVGPDTTGGATRPTVTGAVPAPPSYRSS